MMIWCALLVCWISSITAKIPLPMEMKVYIRREHSLIKPFTSANMDVPMWDYSGNTIVSNSEVRLTPDHQSKEGRIWNTVPIMTPNWEILMQFKVHGSGRTLYGDGFALWYTKENNLQPGPVFGAKNYFTGLGIFFDTYSNHNGEHTHGHPYVSAVVHNGTQNYDHDMDGTHNEVAGCQSSFRGQNHDTYVSVKYINKVLSVHLDVRGKNKWTKCFEVKNVILPIGYHMGLSASTGQLADNHDIVMLKLYEVDLLEGQTVDTVRDSALIPSADGEPDRLHIHSDANTRKTTMSAIWIVFYAFMGLVILLAVIAVAILVWQKHEDDKRRKRFY